MEATISPLRRAAVGLVLWCPRGLGTSAKPEPRTAAARRRTAHSLLMPGGSGAGLRVGPNVDNLNIAQPGSTITNAAQDGILFAGGSANSTVGGFTITNSGDNGVNLTDGDYANTTIQNAVVTTSGSDGVYSNNASGYTITDSNMTLNNGSGVYVDGTASTGVTVRDSSFGIGTGENVAAGNKKYGIAFAGGSNMSLTTTRLVEMIGLVCLPFPQKKERR